LEKGAANFLKKLNIFLNELIEKEILADKGFQDKELVF